MLKAQFSEIWIPTAVEAELNLHPDKSALGEIHTALRERWLRVSPASNSHLLSVLSAELHRGEAEAIALAAEVSADCVLIDEREGRYFAAKVGLKVTGVLGILLHAKLHGEIAAIKPEIALLRSKAHFFIAAALEQEILETVGEI